MVWVQVLRAKLRNSIPPILDRSSQRSLADLELPNLSSRLDRWLRRFGITPQHRTCRHPFANHPQDVAKAALRQSAFQDMSVDPSRHQIDSLCFDWLCVHVSCFSSSTKRIVSVPPGELSISISTFLIPNLAPISSSQLK